MEQYKTSNDGDVRKKFRTPTMSAAKALEKLVADELSSSSRSSTSSRRHHPEHLLNPNLPEPRLRSTPPPSKRRRNTLPHNHFPGLDALRDHLNRRQDPADSSPTDSHPRHTRSNPAGDSISTLLLLTNDRLTQETSRADAAERHARQLLLHLRTAHDAKARLGQDLLKTKTELGLYKAQLDVAQKEIFRAQEIVETVERQRVAAEHQAMKDRERARKLIEEKAVSEALAEGRRMGFQEGLERGRMMALSDERRGRRVEEEIEDDESVDTGDDERFEVVPSSHQSPASIQPPVNRAPSVMERVPSAPEHARPPIREPREPSVTRSRRAASAATTSRSRRPSSPTPVQYDHVPDTARFPPSLPRPSVVSPLPIRVPSTQPQPIPEHNVNPSLARSPEEINVVPRAPSFLSAAHSFVDLDDPTEIRPISVRNRSPSISHRSIVLPPEGYIPTLGENNSILLPPPHELSNPVPPIGAEITHPEENQREPATVVRDYAYPGGMKHGTIGFQANTRDDDAATVFGSMIRGKVPTISTVSMGSTHISQLDLVSPPRGKGKEKSNRARRGGKSRDRESESLGWGGRTRARTQPEQIVEEWRSHNSEILRSLTPSSTSPAPKQQKGAASNSVYAGSMRKKSGHTLNERPKTAESTAVPRSPRMSAGSRLQKHDLPPLPNFGVDRDGASVEQFKRGRDAAPRSPLRREPPRTTAAPERAVSPRNWLRSNSQREGVPNIDVESPSVSPASAPRESVVDPVLLSSEHANRPMTPPLPPLPQPSNHIYSGMYSNQTPNQIHTVLHDNNFPPGFVPLSPIPTTSNFIRHRSPPIHTYEPFIPPSPIMNFAAQKRSTGFDVSPAPLNRPISLFSDG